MGFVSDTKTHEINMEQSKKWELSQRYCTHCGTQLPHEALFCPECGSRVEKTGVYEGKPTIANYPAENSLSVPERSNLSQISYEKNTIQTNQTVTKRRISVLSIFALICSIQFPPLGVLLAIIDMKKTNEKRTLTVIALIVGIIMTIFFMYVYLSNR